MSTKSEFSAAGLLLKFGYAWEKAGGTPAELNALAENKTAMAELANRWLVVRYRRLVQAVIDHHVHFNPERAVGTFSDEVFGTLSADECVLGQPPLKSGFWTPTEIDEWLASEAVAGKGLEPAYLVDLMKWAENNLGRGGGTICCWRASENGFIIQVDVRGDLRIPELAAWIFDLRSREGRQYGHILLRKKVMAG